MLLFALPTLAASGPVTALLDGVLLLQGSPRPEVVQPPRVQARLRLAGLPPGARPRLKLWRVPTEVSEARALGALRPTSGSCTALLPELSGGPLDWELTAPWPLEAHGGDRLLVEVYLGRRRVAWASAEPQIRLRRRTGAAYH